MLILDLMLIIYGLIFIIFAKKISKMIEKTGQGKKDTKRVEKLRIWGGVFFVIGILILLWILF